VRRGLPSLLGALAVFVLVAGGASAFVLGFIPAAQRAAAPFSCPAGTVRAEAHGRIDHPRNSNRPDQGTTNRWRMHLDCFDAAGDRQDADDLRTALALAAPGMALATSVIVGFVVWAAVRATRPRA